MMDQEQYHWVNMENPFFECMKRESALKIHFRWIHYDFVSIYLGFNEPIFRTT